MPILWLKYLVKGQTETAKGLFIQQEAQQKTTPWALRGLQKTHKKTSLTKNSQTMRSTFS